MPVTGYYVGTVGSAVPLAGGIAVLAYRTISYWLPTIPGVSAYVRLRRGTGTQSADRTGGKP